MELRTVKDKVIISLKEEGKDNKTKGGIYVPEGVQSMKPPTGIIEEVGVDVKEVKKGDTVYFDIFSSSKIEADGRTLLIVKEDDIIAILEEE